MKYIDISRGLRQIADPVIARQSARFFKTGAGEYGEGDIFLGIRVPVLRKHAMQFEALPLEETEFALSRREVMRRIDPGSKIQ